MIESSVAAGHLPVKRVAEINLRCNIIDASHISFLDKLLAFQYDKDYAGNVHITEPVKQSEMFRAWQNFTVFRAWQNFTVQMEFKELLIFDEVL